MSEFEKIITFQLIRTDTVTGVDALSEVEIPRELYQVDKNGSLIFRGSAVLQQNQWIEGRIGVNGVTTLYVVTSSKISTNDKLNIHITYFHVDAVSRMLNLSQSNKLPLPQELHVRCYAGMDAYAEVEAARLYQEVAGVPHRSPSRFTNSIISSKHHGASEFVEQEIQVATEIDVPPPKKAQWKREKNRYGRNGG